MSKDPGKIRLTLDLTPDLYEALSVAALRKRKTKSAWIRQAIIEALERERIGDRPPPGEGGKAE